jgi:hypothetical protein
MRLEQVKKSKEKKLAAYKSVNTCSGVSTESRLADQGCAGV